MRELLCHIGFFIQICGFDHQSVRIFADFKKVICSTGIPHNDKFTASFPRAQHLVRCDTATISQSHCVAGYQFTTFGPEGHAEFIRFFGEERATPLFLEDISQTIRPAVCHWKRRDGEIVSFEKLAGFDLLHFQRHWRLVAAQDYIIKKCMHTVECGAPSKDLKFFDGFPSQKSGKQTTQTKDMIEVSMCEQYARKTFESYPRLQDLSLCAFAAVNEKTIFVMRNDLPGKPAFCRWRGSRCSKKENFEQVESLAATEIHRSRRCETTKPQRLYGKNLI